MSSAPSPACLGFSTSVASRMHPAQVPKVGFARTKSFNLARPSSPSSLRNVPDSPPGITRPSSSLSCSGLRTRTTSAPSSSRRRRCDRRFGRPISRSRAKIERLGASGGVSCQWSVVSCRDRWGGDGDSDLVSARTGDGQLDGQEDLRCRSGRGQTPAPKTAAHQFGVGFFLTTAQGWPSPRGSREGAKIYERTQRASGGWICIIASGIWSWIKK